MKFCKECKIKVNTDRITCPLCYSSLIETESDSDSKPVYPEYIKKKGKSNLFYKIIIFLCLASSLITFVINIRTYNESSRWWCLYVIMSMFYIYMLVRGAILTHSYVVKRLVIQLITTSLIVWGFDILSGEVRWAFGYVIPCLAVATNIAIVLITIVNRKNYGEGFMSMIVSLLLGLLPFILQCFGLINIVYLWAPLMSFCVSIGIFLGMIIFAYKATKEEFKKRFHL